MRPVVLLVAAILAVSSTPVHFRPRRSTGNEIKMCVPIEIMPDCEQMVAEETTSNIKITCVAAQDRMECLEKIDQHEADMLAADPEDMYVASKNYPEGKWNIFQEIRTKEEPDAEHRYEAVAVIHKDLDIKDVQGIKGLKSCHTGIGRNVGYKIPITKLKKMGIIDDLNEVDLSPRENELKALSTLFSKACIVGKWSGDPEINKKLKTRYSNLCALCEHPEICDYPDKYSGYDGALRCLTQNGGQIAWTKVIFVKKFFGMPVGTNPPEQSSEDKSQYAYLCPDGSKVPITEKPCTWAARPWAGLMINADTAKTIQELRTKITNLNRIGETKHSHWLESVLEINNKSLVKDRDLISPKEYLENSNYTDVIEREYGPPVKVVRLCVTSDEEHSKCKTFSKSAFSRDIRPRFECIQETSELSCLKAIRDNTADVISLDAAFIKTYKDKYNLKSILTEEHEPSKGKYFSVAVIKKNSPIKNFEDLRGKKSCHSEYNNFASYRAPMYYLIKAGLIKKSNCPYDKAMSEFFSGSCAPGIMMGEYDVDKNVQEKMCMQCVGNLDVNGGNPDDFKCSGDIKEAFHGDSGAFRCLASGKGDVAFVRHNTVKENTDGHNKLRWAKDLKSEDFELLCPKGGKMSVDKYEECNIAKVPRYMVVTSNSKSPTEIDEIRHSLVTASKFYREKSELFKLFGTYKGKQDLLFKDSTTGLVSYENQEMEHEFQKILTETTCKS